MPISAKLWLLVVAAGLAALRLAGPARAADADKLIPADADVVVSINVRQLVDSPAFQKYGKNDALQGLQSPPVKGLLDDLGLDPLKDVDSLLLTSSGDVMGDNPKVLLAARGTFDVKKISAAAVLFSLTHPADLKITKANGLTIYEGAAQGKTVYAHLPAGGTALLASTDKDYLIQAVQTPSPGPSQVMQNALSRVSGDDAIRIAVVATDAMKKRLAKGPPLARKLAPKLEDVAASVSVTTEVVTRLTIDAADGEGADDAKGLLVQGSGVLFLGLPAFLPAPFGPLVKDLYDNNFEIAKDKNSVSVTVRLTEDMLKKADDLKKSGVFDKPDK